jgi:sphingosine kinase
MDLIKVVQDDLTAPGQFTPPVFSFLSVNWGIVSDVDFESEQYRFLGNARFTVGAVVRLLDLRRYRGTISYRPVAGSEANFDQYRRFCSEACPSCAKQVTTYADAHLPDMDQSADDWVELESDFVLAVGCNVAWLGSDINMAPYAHLGDGCIDLIYGMHTHVGSVRHRLIAVITHRRLCLHTIDH